MSYADSLRQQAKWIREALDPSTPDHQRISLEDIDVDELEDAASELDARSSPEWHPIETAPHEQKVLVGWWYDGVWMSETAMASHGWRRDGVSTMSQHGRATHWRPLPTAPEQRIERSPAMSTTL